MIRRPGGGGGGGGCCSSGVALVFVFVLLNSAADVLPMARRANLNQDFEMEVGPPLTRSALRELLGFEDKVYVRALRDLGVEKLYDLRELTAEDVGGLSVMTAGDRDKLRRYLVEPVQAQAFLRSSPTKTANFCARVEAEANDLRSLSPAAAHGGGSDLTELFDLAMRFCLEGLPHIEAVRVRASLLKLTRLVQVQQPKAGRPKPAAWVPKTKGSKKKAARVPSGERETLLVRLFDATDHDGDGRLSLSEFWRFSVKLTGKQVTEGEAAAELAKSDRNNDGAVDLREWIAIGKDLDAVPLAQLTTKLNYVIRALEMDARKRGRLLATEQVTAANKKTRRSRGKRRRSNNSRGGVGEEKSGGERGFTDAKSPAQIGAESKLATPPNVHFELDLVKETVSGHLPSESSWLNSADTDVPVVGDLRAEKILLGLGAGPRPASCRQANAGGVVGVGMGAGATSSILQGIKEQQQLLESRHNIRSPRGAVSQCWFSE